MCIMGMHYYECISFKCTASQKMLCFNVLLLLHFFKFIWRWCVLALCWFVCHNSLKHSFCSQKLSWLNKLPEWKNNNSVHQYEQVSGETAKRKNSTLNQRNLQIFIVFSGCCNCPDPNVCWIQVSCRSSVLQTHNWLVIIPESIPNSSCMTC